MINKPSDIAVIFAIFALVMITIGFGIDSVQTHQNVTVNDSYFTRINLRVTEAEGLKGTADSMSESLEGQSGAGTTTVEDSIIISGFNSLLDLGKIVKVLFSSMSEALSEIGLDPIYWVIVSATILIMFAVTLYSWLRASK